MSDRPIQVGDLVQVVRPTLCCNNHTTLGKIFKVLKIEYAPSICLFCFRKGASLDAMRGGKKWIELARLKRIPPLSELEGEHRKEELTA